MKTRSLLAADQPAAAFSLIEVIGVLTVIGFLALGLVPNIVAQFKQASVTKESAELAGFASGLSNYVIRTRSIPSHTNWAAALASESTVPAGQVATNKSGLARVFLIDPALRIGGATLPYLQTTNGSPRPTSARVLILSSLSQAVPLPSGVTTSNSFNEIWNTPARAKPASWTSWGGTGDTLLIQRINLEPFFHRVTILSADPDIAGTAYFSVNDSPPLPAPATSPGWSAYCLRGTVLGFYDTNATLVAREFVTSDMSRYFEFDGAWRDRLVWGVRFEGTDFAKLAQEFLNSDRRQKSKADQIELLDLMYIFMFNYNQWANEDPCFSYYGGGGPDGVAQYKMMQAARDRLKDMCTRLCNK